MQGKPRHTDFFTPAVGDACENPWKTQTHRFWGAAEGKPKANPRQTHKANPEEGKPRHTDFFTWKTQTHRFWGAAEGKPKANPRQTHKANPEEGKPRHTDFFTPAVGDACGGTDLTVGRERGRLFQETG
jgi:hypothetical protein